MKANVSDRTHGLVLYIAQKMMLYGILLPKFSPFSPNSLSPFSTFFLSFTTNQDISKKSNRLAKLKEMPLDMEGFYEQVLLTVIDHFEKFPCLPNTEAARLLRISPRITRVLRIWACL
jgi:hypothetical protein